MAAVFHKFSDLPSELRDIIWEFAVRPDAPGIHFFTLDDVSPGKHAPPTSCPCRPSSCRSSDCVNVKCLRGIGVGKPVFAGAPVAAPDSQGAWFTNDPSTCLVDAGQWMACKASRAVISRRLGMSSWRRMRDAFWRRWTGGECNCKFLGPDCDSDDAPPFGRFWHADDHDRTPVVFPRNDLFCLRRTDGSRVPSPLQFRKRFSRLMATAPCESVHHWAFEFDDTWDFDLCPLSLRSRSRLSYESDDVHSGNFFWCVQEMLKDAPGRKPCHVYLIDYAVRLKPGAERKTTFHGNGCKFVESDDVEGSSVRAGVKELVQQLESGSGSLLAAFAIQVRLLASVKD